ncbi:Mpp10 protein [Pseudovirgaria hyperparasitica]|uniref:U3 small nucleolar ribonucleoprotein protein MPP10 n=1 Tax=Pseudovirgaria hyperparasitica TaxID=470096 RepID=A0A6A6WC71_9PEZI|nr:Mpp10 protein [Pseudovirgaria hyperparasitica]KAF2759560.1 Mpp10 protein [Pseudovirgaria hyperparasitica]
MDIRSPLADVLLTTLSQQPLEFLQPHKNLHASALALAKQLLDPLASGVTAAQEQRQNEMRKKRKRGENGSTEDMLRMKKVYVEGFKCEQVWEQARRVIDATQEEVVRALAEQNLDADGAVNSVSEDQDDDGEEDGSDREDFIDELGDGEQEQEEEVLASDAGDLIDGSNESDEENMDGMEGLENGLSDEEDVDDTPAEEFVSDKFGLNDGFFSIDTFNKQSQLMEQQNPQEDDEDEEIDFFADPLAGGNVSLTNGVMKLDDDGDDEDEGAPAFGNMNLDAPEGASDMDDDDEDMDAGDINGLTNANNILYADFFAPPASKKGGKNKKKRGRPNPHNFPAKEGAGSITDGTTAENDQADIERAMADVHRDLFSDEDDEGEESELEELDPGDPVSRRSTHERRQAKIAEEIRKLEAENVAKRSWTLSGEARATDRPINSLLEEDLDFERAGKPVPVITAEVSEDIEALIKRRILSSEFDELIRRRPDDLATGPKRRGLVDLPDTKSAKGLGEIYEEEHLAKTDPAYVSAADAKIEAAHDEISNLWNSVSRSLDALCSYHYRPKPAAPSLEIRVDAPALSLEDARPTAGTDMGSASQLAPQEVYKPGQEKIGGEIVTRGGMPVAQEEMEREDKARRRRRAKERAKKEKANEAVVMVGRDGKEVVKKAGKKEQEKEVVGALKRGGVKIIGKKGELTNVDGSQVKGNDTRRTAGAFRL